MILLSRYSCIGIELSSMYQDLCAELGWWVGWCKKIETKTAHACVFLMMRILCSGYWCAVPDKILYLYNTCTPCAFKSIILKKCNIRLLKLFIKLN
jgi:hypothetical protein